MCSFRSESCIVRVLIVPRHGGATHTIISQIIWLPQGCTATFNGCAIPNPVSASLSSIGLAQPPSLDFIYSRYEHYLVWFSCRFPGHGAALLAWECCANFNGGAFEPKLFPRSHSSSKCTASTNGFIYE